MPSRATPSRQLAYETMQQPTNADVPHDQNISPHPRAFGEPGARLVDCSSDDVNTQCQHDYRVRNRSRQKSAPKIFSGVTARSHKQASQCTKRPAHRGMRAANAEETRRRARRDRRREARRAKRRPAHILRPLELSVASQLQVRSGPKKKNKCIFTAKNSAAKLPTVLLETFFKIFHINIESMLVTGRLAELTHVMDSQRCKLARLSEARCPGSEAFRSGDYLILRSGGDRYAGVAYVVHYSLASSILAFYPYSARHLALSFKVAGGEPPAKKSGVDRMSHKESPAAKSQFIKKINRIHGLSSL